jgi:hypothetical protein
MGEFRARIGRLWNNTGKPRWVKQILPNSDGYEINIFPLVLFWQAEYVRILENAAGSINGNFTNVAKCYHTFWTSVLIKASIISILAIMCIVTLYIWELLMNYDGCNVFEMGDNISYLQMIHSNVFACIKVHAVLPNYMYIPVFAIQYTFTKADHMCMAHWAGARPVIYYLYPVISIVIDLYELWYKSWIICDRPHSTRQRSETCPCEIDALKQYPEVQRFQILNKTIKFKRIHVINTDCIVAIYLLNTYVTYVS